MTPRIVWLTALAACSLEGPPGPGATPTPPAKVEPAKVEPAKVEPAKAVAPPPAPPTTWLAQWSGREFDGVDTATVAADGSMLAVGDAGHPELITTTVTAVDRKRLPEPGPERRRFVARFGAHGEVGFRVEFGAEYFATAAVETADGGALVVGQARPPRVDGTEKGPVRADNDGFVARHDAAGKQVWRRHLVGAGSQGIGAIMALPGGGYVIAGGLTGEARLEGDPAAPVFAAGRRAGSETEGFVARIDDEAKVAWVGVIDPGVGGVGVGPGGEVAVIGECRGRGEARGGGKHEAFDCGVDTIGAMVALWDASGALRWARAVPGELKNIRTPVDVAVMSDGDVVIGGMFDRTIGGGEGLPLLTNDRPAYVDGFVARYGGADGKPRWIRHLRGRDGESVRAAARAADGAVWLLADFTDEMEIGDGATYTKIPLRGDDNALLLRLDARGERTYAALIGGKAPRGTAMASIDAGEVRPRAVVVAPNGDLRLAGSFQGRFSFPGPRGPLELEAMQDADGFILACPAPE